jgi:hypothetical protein
MYTPSPYRGSGGTPWVITDSREDPRSRDELRRVLTDAIAAGLGARAIEEPIFHWHAPVKLSGCLFDDGRVDLRIIEAASSTRLVEATFQFEATLANVTAILALTTSIVGLPLLHAWRAWSVRRVRAYSNHALERIWRGLECGPDPYR